MHNGIILACCASVALLVAATKASECNDVTIENARCKFVISSDGYAKSLISKATGEEMLERGARVPFSTLIQNRAYDNEFKLMYAAKPWTLPATKVWIEKDELKIRYRDEFFTAVVKIETTDRYIGFRLLRFDYEMEGSRLKRRTEIDSFALVQIPVKRRGHFGRTLNVVWDPHAFVALMATHPRTRIDAFERESGGLTMFAGGEKAAGLQGLHAVLALAGEKEEFLDCVDAMERDYGLPRGVKNRRHPLASASYLSTSRLAPENIDEYIRIAKECGIRALMTFGQGELWSKSGHFPPRAAYAKGPQEYRRLTDAIKSAGLIPGLHFFCTKVSVADEYLSGGHPDPRMNLVCEVLLARDASETDSTLYIQSEPTLLRSEKNRGLVQFGDELVMYGGFTQEPPYALTNCVRGLWNSKAAPHARNSIGRHLDVDDWVIFVRCSDSGIIDEMADRLAEWINAGGTQFFYMDGAEDVPEPFWYHVPKVQWNVWKRLKTDIIWSETALKSHFGWHMHTRGNAFDVFKGEKQRYAMRKYILRTARQDADDFSPIDFGWLRLQCPEKPNTVMNTSVAGNYTYPTFPNGSIGLQVDVLEFVACKAAAWNSPIGFNVALDTYKYHPHTSDIMAAFRRWETAKIERRFTASQLEELKDENREWFLWPFAPDSAPEPIEYRQITEDHERPVRAFSYSRKGRSGIVYWNVENSDTPEISLPGVNTTHFKDMGRRFMEADMSESDLVAAFRKQLK